MGHRYQTPLVVPNERGSSPLYDHVCASATLAENLTNFYGVLFGEDHGVVLVGRLSQRHLLSRLSGDDAV